MGGRGNTKKHACRRGKGEKKYARGLTHGANQGYYLAGGLSQGYSKKAENKKGKDWGEKL